MVAGDAVVEPVWEGYPLIASNSCARRWIQSCVMLGLARNTIAQYVGKLRSQPRRANANVVRIQGTRA